MNIIVRVTDAELRGTPFNEYAIVLSDLISTLYCDQLDIDDVTIEPGERAEVLFDCRPSTSPEALDMLAMADNITDPEVKDGYFDTGTPTATDDDDDELAKQLADRLQAERE